MKNIIKGVFIFILLFSFTACEENFDEINTNTVDPIEVDQVFLLNNAIIGSSFSTGGLKYDIGIVQQVITPNSGLLTGANYNQDNRDGAAEQWTDYYETVIKHTGDLISRLSDTPEQRNLLNMGRLIQAYTFMVLTDDYGDIPYFEAGKGYSDQIVLPAYDSQEHIYMDLIKEVKEATAGFSDSALPVPGEVLYSGDLDKWRKLGNSLLLRIGMRLVKVNPSMAEQLVKDAVAGGVMTSNDDDYVIRHDNNFTNAIGAT
ncbi:MAG: SusD/RagB family nutrient-binding outer membrane lipoprotein [Leeuwenhoekiella sp.]